jgi:hypothetical protein
MAMESQFGLMVDHMKGNISTIKNMASVLFFGLMEESTLDTGKMVNSTVEGSIFCQMDNQRLGSGLKVRSFDG